MPGAYSGSTRKLASVHRAATLNACIVMAPVLFQTSTQGVAPCVEVWNNTGAITMQAFSVAARCTEANFLVLPEYAPGMTPTYDGRLRLRSRPNADFSLTKMTTRSEERRVGKE